MVLEKLGDALKSSLKKITQSVFFDEKLVNSLIKDIQRALLKADVNVELVFKLSKDIKKRALDEKLPKGISQKEYLIKIVYEELVKFLGGKKNGLEIKKKKPFKIMMVGLFGNGKTTTTSKIANYYKKRGYSIAMVGLDVHRPAAAQQLMQLAEKLSLPVYVDVGNKDPVKVWNKFSSEFTKYDILLIDTAGRDAFSESLVKEIEKLNKKVSPDETLLVISADMGQTAKRQAEQFHESCGVNGVVVTKMDGTAKGGGAISACSATGAPVKFIGVGENFDDLEEFNPEGFVGRLLGMGDLEALLEKAKEIMSEDQAKDMTEKMMKGDFNFFDLFEQINAMKKMGSLSKIVDMIPGMGGMKLPKDMLDVQEDKIQKWKHIMASMTKKELENPDLVFNKSRIERLASGSGTTSSDVRQLLKQYRQAKKMMKKMKGGKGGDMKKMMKNMGMG
ncbi:signal recognition particle protein [archaeon]|jgi:signal recognition particle subunit SRP54|nr:signal recognition particle protein [archaeon]